MYLSPRKKIVIKIVYGLTKTSTICDGLMNQTPIVNSLMCAFNPFFIVNLSVLGRKLNWFKQVPQIISRSRWIDRTGISFTTYY